MSLFICCCSCRSCEATKKYREQRHNDIFVSHLLFYSRDPRLSLNLIKEKNEILRPVSVLLSTQHIHSHINVQFLSSSYQLICSFYYSHFCCWLAGWPVRQAFMPFHHQERTRNAFTRSIERQTDGCCLVAKLIKRFIYFASSLGFCFAFSCFMEFGLHF